MTTSVHFLRQGNRLCVEGPPDLIQELHDAVSYEEKTFLRDYALKQAKREGRSPVLTEHKSCGMIADDGNLYTNFGFYEKLGALVREQGLTADFQDVPPRIVRRPDAYRVDWERVRASGFEPRYKQQDMLQLFVDHPGGRIDCPTGWGKSKVVAVLALLFPKARFLVTTYSLEVLTNRLYPEILTATPSVGIVCSKMPRKTGFRVMCYSSGCLQHANPDDYDFLIADEVHQLCADEAARKLSYFQWSRMWGLSASNDMRFDGKDIRAEGLFGPIRMKITYQEGVENEVVLPIQVHWRNVVMDIDPAPGAADVELQRHAVWGNEHRNRLIVEDAKRIAGRATAPQVLISVDTFEHLMHLHRLDPSIVLFYRAPTLDRETEYRLRHSHLMAPGFEMMSDEMFRRQLQGLTGGKPGIYASTPCLNVGVDMKYLTAVIRGNAGSSAIADTQVPGRASRVHGDKQVAHVVDYLDQFNPTLFRRARQRFKHYETHQWEQRFPDGRNPFRVAQLPYGQSQGRFA